MSEVRINKKSLILFGAIALLAIMQVSWWVTLFQREVNALEALRVERETLQATVEQRPEDAKKIASIQEQAKRTRIMFLSESLFFILLTLLGLWMLFRAFRSQERSRALERRFLQMVSHESKTPLTALKLRLESIQEDQPSDQISLALDEVRRLTSLFENTLNLHRLEQRPSRLSRVGISDVIRDVARRMEPVFKSQNVHVNLELRGDNTVRADPQGLQSSIQSIFENAVRYNPADKKEIWVTAHSHSQGTTVDIEDNGPGIDPEDRAHLFERFYRGKTGREIPGTGVGLYIVDGIVKAHGGNITCLPGSHGHGTRFRILLPGGAA